MKFRSQTCDSSLPHTDDPLLFQETSFELAKHRSGMSVEGHVELYRLVKGTTVIAHHAAEVLTSVKS